MQRDGMTPSISSSRLLARSLLVLRQRVCLRQLNTWAEEGAKGAWSGPRKGRGRPEDSATGSVREGEKIRRAQRDENSLAGRSAFGGKPDLGSSSHGRTPWPGNAGCEGGASARGRSESGEAGSGESEITRQIQFESPPQFAGLVSTTS